MDIDDMQMHTNCLKHSETRAVAIAAAPDRVLALVGDARRLPDWAPSFARAVRPDGDSWIVDTGGGDLRISLSVSVELGTADILLSDDPREGVVARVVPNCSGSEFLFTMLFPDGTDPAVIDAQMRTVEQELRTVRALCEA
jgi:hypothetical protein